MRRTARGFERLLRETWDTLPPDLQRLGYIMLLALRMAVGQERLFEASPLLRKLLKDDVDAFMAPYAAHMASHGV